MDRHESKASKIDSKCGHPSSPDKKSRLWKENSLGDANVGEPKQLTSKAEKLSGTERKDRISYSGCTKESKTDKHGKTESSSSNTPHIIPPASSNDSCQETSLEIQSRKLGMIYATDSSTCTDLKSSKEPGVGSLQPGMTICNPDGKLENTVSPAKGCNVVKVSETLDSVRTRNSDNLSGMRSSDNLSAMSSDNNYVAMENIDSSKPDLFKREAKKIAVQGKTEKLHKLEDAVDVAPAVAKDMDQDSEASGSSSSIDGRNSERFPRSFVDSAGSNGKSCLTETGSESQQSKGEDKSFSFCSVKEAVSKRPSSRNENPHLEAKEPFPGMFPEMTREVSDSLEQELPCQPVKDVGLSPSDRSAGSLSKFDLNEDVVDPNVEYFGRSGKETVSSDLTGSLSKPKPVMGKPGTPIYFLAPKIEKEGGWRGSTKTSAFQPTSLAKNSLESNKGSPINDESGSEKRSAMEGIDLNLDAAEDEIDVDSLQDKPTESSFHSSTKVGSTQTRKLDFDLNCVSVNEDNSHQPPSTTSLSKQSVRDFDLNDDLATMDTGYDAFRPSQGLEMRKPGPDIPLVSYMDSPKQQDFRSFRPPYSADVRSMPGFIPGHVQPFLLAPSNMIPSSEQLQRVSFLQPQLAYSPSMHHAFRVDPKDGVYQAVGTHGMVPYMMDPHATTGLTPVIGSSALPTYPTHVFQVPHGSSSNNISITMPNFEAYNRANPVENVSRGANSGQLFVPLNNPTLEEQMKSFQQLGVPGAAGAKRREPEGGWDSPQLCFRQMTSWR